MSDSDFNEKMLSNKDLSAIIDFNLKEFDREMKVYISSLRGLLSQDNFVEFEPQFNRIMSEIQLNVISTMESIAVDVREESVVGTFDNLILINNMSDEQKMKYIDLDRDNHLEIFNSSEEVSNYQKMKWEL